jgi:hypothetical protein
MLRFRIYVNGEVTAWLEGPAGLAAAKEIFQRLNNRRSANVPVELEVNGRFSDEQLVQYLAVLSKAWHHLTFIIGGQVRGQLQNPWANFESQGVQVVENLQCPQMAVRRYVGESFVPLPTRERGADVNVPCEVCGTPIRYLMDMDSLIERPRLRHPPGTTATDAENNTGHWVHFNASRNQVVAYNHAAVPNTRLASSTERRGDRANASMLYALDETLVSSNRLATPDEEAQVSALASAVQAEVQTEFSETAPPPPEPTTHSVIFKFFRSNKKWEVLQAFLIRMVNAAQWSIQNTERIKLSSNTPMKWATFNSICKLEEAISSPEREESEGQPSRRRQVSTALRQLRRFQTTPSTSPPDNDHDDDDEA